MSEPEVIELPNIPAEYQYIKRLSCNKCGQPVEGERQGSSRPEVGRVYDTWDTMCTKCGATRQIILSIPE